MSYTLKYTGANIDDILDRAVAGGQIDIDIADRMQKGVDYVTAGQLSGSSLGTGATAEGDGNVASGNYSHAEGGGTEASGLCAHAEGDLTVASGQHSHAEGTSSQATGQSSHAEGSGIAQGDYSHAEGSGTAQQSYSHAEGEATTASGRASHAEGSSTTASGTASHAQGIGTRATSNYQTALGKYNATGASYAEMVGNGTSNNARSNARTLDWDGNEVVAGKYTMGATPTADMDAVPKKWLDAAFVTDTASGSIASFSDGADGIPVKSLVAEINPVQDLNGQDAPYPAGGGKNIFAPTSNPSTNPFNYVTMALTGDTYTFTGTADSNGGRNTLKSASFSMAAGTYTISATGTRQMYIYVVNEGDNSNLASMNGSDTSATFTLAAQTTVHVGFAMVSGTTYADSFKIQIESGSTATAYAPYSNICPISGWTGATVTRTGANLSYTKLSGCSIGSSSVITSNASYDLHIAKVKAGEAYIFSTDDGTGVFAYYSAEPTVGATAYNGTRYTSPTGIITAPTDGYIAFRSSANYANAQLNVGSAATAYEAYTGDTYAIDWTNEGTVYKGTLTALGGGKWSVQPTQRYVALNSLTWVYVSGRFRASVTDIANVATRTLPMLCSDYQVISDGRALASVPDYSIYNGGGTPTYLFVHDSRYADAASFNANVTGTVLYPLATLPDPIIVSASDLETLLGANNIWASTGNVSVTYRADTKLYIAKVTA